ncbi:hypothetical protein LCGC14_0856000 [marine sediment metagenome]|uniref:Uncharacterized protein n=1 Tax=marine sediment metagenome TaxID=412755 RepID=A0A0F9SFZ8_9ZZZZ
MSKETKMIDFAIQNDLNLTGSLSHDQVNQLANLWKPQIRWHEKEVYHPINLKDYSEIPASIYPTLTPEEKEEYEFKITVLDDSSFKVESFEPAVMKNKGPVRQFTNGQGQTGYITTSNVLASLDGIVAELLNDDIDSGTEISQGNGAKGSKFFFGSKSTISGQENSSAGDPFLPEHDIKIIAEYKVLIDLLEYELLVEEANDYPITKDALRGGFSITSQFFFRSDQGNSILSASTRRNIMQALIAAHKSGNNVEFQNTIESIPSGWRFNFNNWAILKGYSFMEYYFYYAYSNWSDYENDLFSNYHEGDVEGCCVVFETKKVEMEFSLPNPNLLNIPPISVITSVHEEYQNLDKYKTLDSSHAREDLNVWVALGSHATYLTSGNHDVVDFGVLVNTVIEKVSILVIPLLPFIIIAAIIEHFIDVEDQTSDSGGFTDNNIPDGSDNRHFQSTIETTPLSDVNNIYKNNNLEALAVRSYQGKYGGTSGFKNNSGTFKNKSGRYFRKLTRNLRVSVID